MIGHEQRVMVSGVEFVDAMLPQKGHQLGVRDEVATDGRAGGYLPVDVKESLSFRVQIDLEKDDHDHLVSPEKRFRAAMARQ